MASPRDPVFGDPMTVRAGAFVDVVDRLVAVDLESSGLHRSSYPIELGWALVVEPENERSVLISPDPGWSVGDWDAEAQVVHGIDRARLVADGKPAHEAVAEFEASLPEGAILVSDAPSYDEDWIRKLYAAAGRTAMPFIQLVNAVGVGLLQDRVPAIANERSVFAYERIENVVDFQHPPTHRAGRDAGNLARVLHRCATGPVDELVRLGRYPGEDE